MAEHSVFGGARVRNESRLVSQVVSQFM